MKKLIMLLALVTVLPGIAFAASNYYAKSTVWYNVPSDPSFQVAMPSDYTSWTDITGETEGGATAVNWISFNYTSINNATLQEPWEVGVGADRQNHANLWPIFYVDPDGNTNIQLDVYLAASPPAGLQVYTNFTCGTCTSPQNDLIEIGETEGSATTLTTDLDEADYGNISLYSNTSSVTGGTSSGTVYIKSSVA